MSEEELIETLKAFENKRVEQLKEPARNVFYAIMKIADERDKYKKIIKEVREYIMSELISEWDIKNNGYVSGSDLPVDAITPILEILDKENI